MKKIFTLNHIFIGIIIGVVLAAVTFFIGQWVFGLLSSTPYWLSNPKVPYMIAFIPNLILFRVFMVNKKMDKTGKGILLVTFLGILAVFFFI